MNKKRKFFRKPEIGTLLKYCQFLEPTKICLVLSNYSNLKTYLVNGLSIFGVRASPWHRGVFTSGSPAQSVYFLLLLLLLSLLT